MWKVMGGEYHLGQQGSVLNVDSTGVQTKEQRDHPVLACQRQTRRCGEEPPWGEVLVDVA